MELGDPVQRAQRSAVDVVLDKLNQDFAELLETVEGGGLDQLTAAQKISFWEPTTMDRPSTKTPTKRPHPTPPSPTSAASTTHHSRMTNLCPAQPTVLHPAQP
jgi:hypothetical protein